MRRGGRESRVPIANEGPQDERHIVSRQIQFGEYLERQLIPLLPAAAVLELKDQI
ncbi:MAG: hypothetical protein K0Q72_3746 [Armatimonadetes bacterium]|jgi:hypothetical protein|nr:hypothetical protein [Armatimonadota bacterium]